MPQVYREELRLTRDLDSATRQAAEQWMRLAHIKVPRWWLICAAIAPFVLMTGSFMVLLVAALLRMVNGHALPGLLLGVWLILIPAQLFAAHVAMKNVLVSGATNVGAAFAAAPCDREPWWSALPIRSASRHPTPAGGAGLLR